MLLLEGREWAQSNSENCPEMFDPIPKTVYVNIASMDCKSDQSQLPSTHHGAWCLKIFSLMSSNLGLSADSDVTTIEDRLRADQKPKQKQKRRYVILVLDEIDLLLNSKSAADGEFLLHTLFRWSSDPNIAFTLIGISNNTDSKSLKKLTELGKKGQGKVR
jgi:Cdc6-like AAA superfamily ATPase